MRVCMGGSGIHYSLNIYPIIHLIKVLDYSLKFDQWFIKSKKGGKEIWLFTIHYFFLNSLKNRIIH